MTIAVGTHYVNSATINTQNFTSPGINTSASGSTFLVFVDTDSPNNKTPTVTDSKSNTYTAVTLGGSGNGLTDTNDGGTLFLYTCYNATGGAGMTFSVSMPAASNVFAVNFIELTGAATTSTLNTSNTVYATTGPPLSCQITTTVANCMVIGFGMSNSGNRTISSSNVNLTTLDQYATATSIGSATFFQATAGTIDVDMSYTPGGGQGFVVFALAFASAPPVIPYTIASSSTPSLTGTTGTFTLPETCAPNDLILVQWEMDNVGSVSIPTITDNVNNLTYTSFGPPVYYSTGSKCYGQSFVACVANGTPKLTVTNLSANNMKLNVTHVTGFTGIPTLDQLAATTAASGTSVTNTITTTHNTEFVATTTFSGSTFSGTPSGWTSTGSGGNAAIAQLYWQYAASTGAVSLSGTLTATSYNYNFEFSFFNGVPPTSYYVDGMVWL